MLHVNTLGGAGSQITQYRQYTDDLRAISIKSLRTAPRLSISRAVEYLENTLLKLNGCAFQRVMNKHVT